MSCQGERSTLAAWGWRARAYAASSALQHTRLGATRSVRRSLIVTPSSSGELCTQVISSWGIFFSIGR